MWLSLLLFILILCVVVFQAAQGLYSALIMTVLTVCCAGAAFGVHEWVAMHWLATWWKPDYAFAVALGLTFAVPLLVLRVAIDQALPRACLLPAWVDRIGGGVCGVITGLILVGVLATCLQLIPFDKKVLDYARLPIAIRDTGEDGPEPQPPDPDAEESELWVKPDRFAVAVASMLSDGLFSGPRSLSRENPDLIQAIGWLNAVPSEVSRYAPPGSIDVKKDQSGPLRFVHKYTPGGGSRRNRRPGSYESEQPKPNHEFQMVRIELKKEAQNKRKSHHFTLTQFRLVGREPGIEALQQLFPIAIQQNDVPEDGDTTAYHIKSKKNRWGSDWAVTDEVFMPRSDNNSQVEIVFEVPTGFEPEYIEYKRGAREPLSFDDRDAVRETDPGADEDEPDRTASAPRPASPSPATGGTVPVANRGGRVRRFTTRSGRSFFGSQMPVTLTSYNRYKNADISRGALADGHLVGFADEQEGGNDTAVSKFDVPSDKRLLHLSTEVLKARSTLGGALNFAVRTLQNFLVTDSQGRQYKVVGKYAIADVEGRQVVEIQYFSHQAGSIGGVGKFNKLRDNHFKGDYVYVLLFLVEPGAEIDYFTTGGASSRRDDLLGENLVAPG